MKRKMKKEVRKEDKEKVKPAVAKQNYDNQTLQQLMMAQMMSSRARSSNGEGSWISVQNQANADKIRYQQELNALKARNKELKKQADDIEQNEKYKDMKDKYENERKELERKIEELNEAREMTENLKTLELEKDELQRKIDKMEKEYNSPVEKRKRTIKEMQAEIEELKKRKDNDPLMMKDVAKLDEEITALTKKMQLMEELNKKNNDIQRLNATVQAKMNTLRFNNPELKGVNWNGKNTDELIMNISATLDEQKIHLNNMIEKLSSECKEMNVINQAKATYNFHLGNMMQDHPLFIPTYMANAKSFDGQRSAKEEAALLNKSMHDYIDDLGMSTFAVLSGHAALNQDVDIKRAERAFSDLMSKATEKNSVYKKFVDVYNNDLTRGRYIEKLRKDLKNEFGFEIEKPDAVLDTIARGERPSFIWGSPAKWDEWRVNIDGIPLTEGINLVKQTIEDMDEVNVAQFGPGREGIQRPLSAP